MARIIPLKSNNELKIRVIGSSVQIR